MIIDTNTPISLTDTVSSMLRTIIESQEQSARATIDYIKEFCKETPEGLSLDTAKIKYSKLDENYAEKEFTLEIPLLSLVNIPVIEIKKSTIAFSYEVMGHDSAVSSGTKKSIPISPLIGRVQRKSSYDQTSSELSEKGNLNVYIELEKAPIPIGLERLLNVLEVYNTSG